MRYELFLFSGPKMEAILDIAKLGNFKSFAINANEFLDP